MSKQLTTILSIAGSDPTGGAGIQADIRAGNEMGVHVLTAVTAVTVQNSTHFFETGVVSATLLEAQLKAIIQESTPQAIKIGLIGSEENFQVIADFLSKLGEKIPVVVDPLINSTIDTYNLSGCSPNETRDLYVDGIFPFSTVATPNREEWETLSNLKEITEENLKKSLNELNLTALAIKGGHSLEGSKLEPAKKIDDLLITQNGEEETFTHPRIECKNLHGTGCVFSTLMAANLAFGKTLREAFHATCESMSHIIDKSCNYSLGNSLYGPLNINQYKL